MRQTVQHCSFPKIKSYFFRMHYRQWYKSLNTWLFWNKFCMSRFFLCFIFPIFLVYYYLPSKLCMGSRGELPIVMIWKATPTGILIHQGPQGGFCSRCHKESWQPLCGRPNLQCQCLGKTGRGGVISLLHPGSPPSLTTPSLLYPLTTHSGIKYYVKQNVILPHSKFFKEFLFWNCTAFSIFSPHCDAMAHRPSSTHLT